MAIYRELDGRSITTDRGIAAALGIPAAEATVLLRRKHFQDGDLVRLEAAAARLGVHVPN